MKKGRTMTAIHNYDATSFIYVKVPALVAFAEEEALRLGQASKHQGSPGQG